MYSPSIKFQLPLCPKLTCVLLPAEKNRLVLKLQMLGIENRTLIHSKTQRGFLVFQAGEVFINGLEPNSFIWIVSSSFVF